LQAPAAVQHRAGRVGQNHFQRKRIAAHVTEAQEGTRAPRIGGRHAARHGVRPQVYREEQAVRLEPSVDLRKPEAGADAQAAVVPVEFEGRAQAVKAEHALPAAVVRRRAADQARIAGLRHQRNAVAAAESHHLRNGLGRGRPRYEGCAAAFVARRILIGRHVRRQGQQALRTEHGGELPDRIGRRRHQAAADIAPAAARHCSAEARSMPA